MPAYIGMAMFSLAVFLAVEVGSRFHSGLAVRNESEAQAWEQILRYVLQPEPIAYLSSPFLIVGLLGARVANRATLEKALWVLLPAFVLLGWLYYAGQFEAAYALQGRKWTASAIAVGLRPVLSVPVVLGVVVLQWLIVRKHRARTPTAANS